MDIIMSSIKYTFLYHFLCLTISIIVNFLHILATLACTMSFSYVMLHIWPSRGLMRMMGENIVKTAFTFSALKKVGIQYFWKKILKMNSWKIWKSTKRKKIERLGAL